MSRRSFTRRHPARPINRTTGRWVLHGNVRAWVRVFAECAESVPAYYYGFGHNSALARWPRFVNSCQGV